MWLFVNNQPCFGYIQVSTLNNKNTFGAPWVLFSSDACCFRNGQLEQLNDGEGWGKQKHFIQAKTLEKFIQTRIETKKLQKIQPLTILYIKKVPLSYTFYQ